MSLLKVNEIQKLNGDDFFGDAVINLPTLVAAVAATNLVVGDAINLAERVGGSGGGAIWDVVLSTSVTENLYNIIQCTGVPTLSLVLRVGGVIDVKQFGAIGDGIIDDSLAIQAALNTSKTVAWSDGLYNLAAATITTTESQTVVMLGGVLTNGTLGGDNTIVIGQRGLDKSIILNGTFSHEKGIPFDWFACSKGWKDEYDTFINGISATYGVIPVIPDTNRLIYKMLVDNNYPIAFGSGIYAFDDEVIMSKTFNIEGTGDLSTLIWCPSSHFMNYLSGGATFPTIRRLSIECSGNVIRTQAWTTNAIHEMYIDDIRAISYSDHTFLNDVSTAGGTGCPIYGGKVTNSRFFAGEEKSMFAYYNSGSVIYDKISDAHTFFSGYGTQYKATTRSFLYNSNAKAFVNCNTVYSATKYIAYYDQAGALFSFTARDCIFENNATGIFAVVFSEATTSSSNLNLNMTSNTYVGEPKSDEGTWVVTNFGNLRVYGWDSTLPIFGTRTANYTYNKVLVITSLLDSGATKRRLRMFEPQSAWDVDASQRGTLMNVTRDTAITMGFTGALYDSLLSELSFLEVMNTRNYQGSRQMGEGKGGTSSRPTINLWVGMPYFDTTLGYSINWNGTNWVNGSGTTV